MKIAITARGNTLDSEVDPRFGRAKGFIIYDTESGDQTYIDNKMNMESVQGAGIQSAQNILNNNVSVVITGHCGPKAFDVLNQASIKIFSVGECTVREAINKYKYDNASEMNSADVNGHW